MDNYLAAFDRITENLHSIAYVSDANYNLVAVSQKFLEEFFINDKEDILNKSLYKCNAPALQWYANNHEILEGQYQEITAESKNYLTLDIIDYGAVSRMYIVHKSPIVITGKILGIYTYMRPFGLPRLEDLIHYSNGVNSYSKPMTIDHKLTAKQRMVLFLFLRNYSYSETSNWMGAFGYKISSSRVSEHLTALKNILGAKDSVELRELAIQYGYHSEMPAGFLPNGSYCIENYLTEISSFTDYPLQLSHLYKGYTYSADSFIKLADNDCVVFNSNMDNEISIFRSFYAHTTEMAVLVTKAGKLLIATGKFLEEIGNSLNDFISAVIPDLDNLHVDQANHFLEIMNNGKIYLLQKQFLGKSIHIQLRKYVMPTIHRLMIDVFKVFSLPKTSLPPDFRITERQHQILFFYARYYSYTQVSTILGMLGFALVPTTVNEHLEALKKTLNVNSKDQLIDAALIIGYAIIPSSLLKPGSFRLTNTDIHKWVC